MVSLSELGLACDLGCEDDIGKTQVKPYLPEHWKEWTGPHKHLAPKMGTVCLPFPSILVSCLFTYQALLCPFIGAVMELGLQCGLEPTWEFALDV